MSLCCPVIFIAFVASVGETVEGFTCQKGDFFHLRKQVCLPCKKCNYGEAIQTLCEGTQNTVCQKCPKGSYLKENKCTNCTFCLGRTIHQCNATADAICKETIPGANGPKIGIIVGATVGAVILLLAVAGIVICIRRRVTGTGGDDKESNASEEEHEMMNGNSKNLNGKANELVQMLKTMNGVQ